VEVKFLTPFNVPPNFNEFRRRPDLTRMMMEDGQEIAENYDFAEELKLPQFIRYVGAVVEDHLVGWFKFQKMSTFVWDCHMCLDWEVRGRDGLEAAREAISLMQREYRHCTLIGRGAGYNRPSLYFGFALGFRPVGKIPKSLLKDGKLWDQYLMWLPPAPVVADVIPMERAA